MACSEPGYLSFFLHAAQKKNSNALNEAVKKALVYITDKCATDTTAANVVSNSIATVVASFFRIDNYVSVGISGPQTVPTGSAPHPNAINRRAGHGAQQPTHQQDKSTVDSPVDWDYDYIPDTDYKPGDGTSTSTKHKNTKHIAVVVGLSSLVIVLVLVLVFALVGGQSDLQSTPLGKLVGLGNTGEPLNQTKYTLAFDANGAD